MGCAGRRGTATAGTANNVKGDQQQRKEPSKTRKEELCDCLPLATEAVPGAGRPRFNRRPPPLQGYGQFHSPFEVNVASQAPGTMAPPVNTNS